MTLSQQLVFSLLLCVRQLHGLTVQLQARYPASNEGGLTVRGQGCGLAWDADLQLQADGHDTYSVSVTCTAGEKAELKLVLGGEAWQQGANDAFIAQTDRQVVKLYPWFNAVEGNVSVVMKQVWSPELQNHRDVAFYLPPSFGENPYKIYRTLVAGDGQNMFDPKTSGFGCWLAQQTLDPMIMSGEIGEVVIVAPYNTGTDRCDEYTYDVDTSEKCGGKADLYLDFVSQTLLPAAAMFLQGRLDLSVNGQLTMIGSSLGGLLSCYAAWQRPEIYRAGLCMSPSMWWNSEDFIKLFIDKGWNPKNVSVARPTLYLDVGGQEVAEMQNSVHDSATALGSHGWTEGQDYYFYAPSTGDHNEKSWGARLHVPLQLIFGCGTGPLGTECTTPGSATKQHFLVA